MKKVFAVIFAFMLTTFSIAQEWVEHAGIEYNCDVLNGILEDYGDKSFARSAGSVTIVSDVFGTFFPSCPSAMLTASNDSNPVVQVVDSKPAFTENSYSFSSVDEGLQPVLGPISLTKGVYIFTATTEDFMIVSPTSLAGDCGSDLKYSIFSISAGDGSNGAQSVVEAEEDCSVLLEVSLVSQRWTLSIKHIIPSQSAKLIASDGSYSFSSVERLQPVLGPLLLSAGVHVFTATTDDFMLVTPTLLSGDCGSDLKYSIFSISAGDGSNGAQSLVEAEEDCTVLLEVSMVSDAWTLDIEKVS